MSKKDKTEEVAKNKTSWVTRFDYLAKGVAYIALIISASYGIRKIMENIDSRVALGFTTLAVLALVYIIFSPVRK